MKEIDVQRRLINSIQATGGFARKWASPYSVGVPDLIASVPEVGMVGIEVKFLKRWSKDTGRTVKLTDKQHDVLAKLNRAGGKVAVCIAATFTNPPAKLHIAFFPPIGLNFMARPVYLQHCFPIDDLLQLRAAMQRIRTGEDVIDYVSHTWRKRT